MSKTPSVSIVTLAYNHGKYIRQCLEGFVMQVTDFPFEVIIHDDASTDDTAEIIREYEQKYPDIIKPIYQTENQYSKGVAIGATFLYPNAKGKYIAECEGDDWWTDPHKLQKQVDYMESHPKCSMCCTNYSSFRMKDEFMKTDEMTSRRFNTLSLMRSNKIGTLTVLYRKHLLMEYLEKVKPKMPSFRMGDVPLWLWMTHKGYIKELPENTAVYRVLESSASHSKDFIRQLDFELEGHRVRLWMNKELKLHYKPLIMTEIMVTTRNFCRKWARTHNESKNTLLKKAIKHFRSSRRHH